MPTSRPYHLTWLCNAIIELQPKRILDVGIGFGSKGMLFREYTDVWNGRMFDQQTVIDGVEIFPQYITDLQRKIYNNIYEGDVRELIHTLDFYDLIYMGDVLEHLNREDGARLIANLKQRCTHLIIVTPVQVSPQGGVYGNESETHISQWAPMDFQGFDIITINNSLVAHWRRPEVYYCEGMKFYGERMENVFGFRKYSGNVGEELLFMGLYFQEDYDVYSKHIGKKTVFWNGSDVSRLLQHPEWVEILQLHPSTHVCHNEQLREELASVGIAAIVEPIFFARPKDYPKNFKENENLEVYINAHPGREEEYGVDHLLKAAERLPDARFFVYGVDGPDTENVQFLGRLEEADADSRMVNHNVLLRLNEHDGLSQLVIKAGLWGQQVITTQDIKGTIHIDSPDQIVKELKKLQQHIELNTEIRKTLQEINLNRFSWL